MTSSWKKRPEGRKRLGVQPRVLGTQKKRHDRCLNRPVSGGEHNLDSRAVAYSPLQPLRRWKATFWTLAIFLSLLVSSIASSPVGNWSPGNNPLSRETLARDRQIPPSQNSTEIQGNPEPGSVGKSELPTQSARHAADYGSATSRDLGEPAEDLLSRSERASGRPRRRKKKDKSKPSKSQRGKKKPKGDDRKSGRDTEGCRIRNLTINVGDLGMGYMSEEIVLFKYCSGSCPHSRTNYDQIITKLLHEGMITSKVVSHPCCRPVKYEPASFMDLQNNWKRVEKLSAAECKCVG